MEHLKQRRFVFLLLAIAVVVTSALRFLQFGDLDPRMDQASFAVWIQDFLESERFLPLADTGDTFVQALKADEGSALNVLLRRIYVVHDHIFVTVSFVWFALWSLVFGVGMEGQIAISIVSGTLAIGVLAWLPLSGARGGDAVDRNWAILTSAAVFLFGVGNGFLNVFSALGVHNAGLLGLAIAILGTQNWLWALREKGPSGTGFRDLAIVMAAQAVAFYSHYTVVFLLPLATVLAIALMPGQSAFVKRRAVFVYGLAGLLCALPFFALVAVAQPAAQTDQDVLSRLLWVLTQEGYSAGDFLHRAARWWSTMAEMGSPAGLLMGICGCVMLAVRERAALPISLIIVHFLVGLTLPGFTQYDRTGTYAVLVLCLGAGWFSVSAIRYVILGLRYSDRRKAILAGSALGLALTIHGVHEFSRIVQPNRIVAWRGLIVNAGNTDRFVNHLQLLLPGNALFFAWDYRLWYTVRALSPRIRAQTRQLRPLESYMREHSAGRLQSYVKERGMRFPRDVPLYFLVPKSVANQVPNFAVSVMGPKGLALRKEVATRPVKTLTRWYGGLWFENFILYAVP